MFRNLKTAILFCSLWSFHQMEAIETIDKTNLTILTFNDVYDAGQQNGFAGLAGLKTMLDEERKTCEHYVTTVAGDFLSPSVLSGVSGGKHMIELFNFLEVDAVTFGNHEFDLDIETVKQRMRESQFTWLGTNVIDVHTGLPFHTAKSTIVFQLGEFKFGLIGLTTTETAELANAPRDLLFAPVVISAQAAVHNLKKKGVDVVIALTHLNLSEDIQLARAVPEINLILGGHDHDPVALMEGNTLIYKAGMDARFLGRIDLAIERTRYKELKPPKLMIYPSHKLLVNHGYTPDKRAQEILKGFQDQVTARTSIQLGIVSGELSSEGVRDGENSFGNLIASAMRKSCQADLALINAGGIRGGRTYPDGHPLNREDLHKELPFGNIIVMVEMTGEQIIQALEHSLAKSKDRGGAFLQSSGISVVYDPKAIKGHCVQEVLIQQKPIDKVAFYKVAITDYMLRGGDGNIWFNRGRTLITPGIGHLLLDVVADYIKQVEIVKSYIEGKFVEKEAMKDIDTILMKGNVKRISFPL